jgi:hypothetical protein
LLALDIKLLLNYAVTYLADQHDYELHWSRPFHRQEFNSVKAYWRRVEEQLAAPVPTVIIVCLEKPQDHWTVVQQARPEIGRARKSCLIPASHSCSDAALKLE